MPKIPLSNGGLARVDAIELPNVRRHIWWLTPHGYARCRKLGMFLHTFILGRKSGFEIDHVNGDKLDCRRVNLRHVDRSQNQANTKPKRGTSSFKGVHRLGTGWVAQIQFRKQKLHLGMFASATAAALAYDQKAREVFGNYARLNYPGRVLKTPATTRKFSERQCRECNKPFNPYHETQKYCSKKCGARVASRSHYQRQKSR